MENLREQRLPLQDLLWRVLDQIEDQQSTPSGDG
jgi:hypothetical protein